MWVLPSTGGIMPQGNLGATTTGAVGPYARSGLVILRGSDILTRSPLESLKRKRRKHLHKTSK